MKGLIAASYKVARKSARYGRLGGNLVAGSSFIAACYQFPKFSNINDKALNDYHLFRAWVDDLAFSMNTEVVVSGDPVSSNALFASNHISWLDTIVFNKVRPLSFIARHDLVGWPLIGKFTQRMDCVYVNRSNKFQAYRSIPAIEERLKQGGSVHLFPESTTSSGLDILPFYPMFFEAAVRAQVPVQPVVINYLNGAGNRIVAPAFIDDDSFLDTLDRILAEDKVYAHVQYLKPLSPKKLQRKQLSSEARKMIVSAHKKTCM